jgi:membrane protein DedA with SNARE-associated domain
MIGEDIIAVFSSLGDVGMLLALTVIILIDGTGFPTLPEVWMVFIFGANADSFTWGVLVVLVASLASLGGNFTLYSLVKLARPPRWIKKAMTKYTDFLIVSDERLLLLNRLAPVVPYTGAFMAVCNWNVRKCALYLITGALAKSSAVVILCWLSYDNVRQELAPWVALIAVVMVMLASVIVSVVYKRRLRLKEGSPRSQ